MTRRSKNNSQLIEEKRLRGSSKLNSMFYMVYSPKVEESLRSTAD